MELGHEPHVTSESSARQELPANPVCRRILRTYSLMLLLQEEGCSPFFERTGKHAVQRASMQMDILVEGITLYAGQVMLSSGVFLCGAERACMHLL